MFFFFLKFLAKKSQCVLWASASYGLGNMVLIMCLGKLNYEPKINIITVKLY
jgi:hypothetical protein